LAASWPPRQAVEVMRMRIGWMSVVIVTVMLVSSPGVQAEPALQGTGNIEPSAGAWTTWLLSSGSELRLPPPPGPAETRTELADVQALAAQRDGAASDRITYWDAGSPGYRWTQRAVKFTQDHGVVGNRAARMLALMNVAIYDATVSSWDSKFAYNRSRPSGASPGLAAIPPPASPSYPDERAAAAGAASSVLTYIFPNDAETFDAWANEASWSRVEAGIAYPSDASAGMALGQEVGERAVAWGKGDGSDAVWTGTVPVGPGKWLGTNPVEPLAGTRRPWGAELGQPVPAAAPRGV
jgi:hypothetical protein